MIAVVEAWKAGAFTRRSLVPNLLAGLVVSVVALPLAMAFAIASGVRPEYGLYTAIVAGFVVSVFGGSRVQIAGPTGAFISILAVITAKYGLTGLQLATLMAGVILVLMGLTKMGAVVKFIPVPVVVGFTSGIGVIIWVGEWKDFFGLPAIQTGTFHEKLWHSIFLLPHLHRMTTVVGLVSLLLVIASPNMWGLRRVPGPLVALVLATIAQALFKFDGVATIGSAFGGIPQALPMFSFPAVGGARMLELVGPAFTIAMLAAIESLLSAVVADGMAGTKHNSNQELIGQGLANMATPFFGGFAATGAIARTATSVRNGGSNPLAGITHALALVAIVLFCAPLANNVPLAALAAILFVVAYNMSDAKHFAHIIRRAPRADVAILSITFLLTVFADLVVAVNIGVILAMFQFLRRMAASIEVQQLSEQELSAELATHGLVLPPGVLVYDIDGPIFFGAVENFERALVHTHTDPRVLVMRLHHVPFIDMTGLQALEEVIRTIEKRGVRVLLCEANHKVKRKLERAGILDVVEPDDYLADLSAVVERCNALLAADGPAPRGRGP